MWTALSVRPFTYSVEELRGPDEKLSAGNRRRAKGVIVEIIFGEQFELRTGFENRGQTILIGDIDLAVRQHRRGAVDGLVYALGPPDFFTGFGVQAPHDAAIIHGVEVSSIGDGRG